MIRNFGATHVVRVSVDEFDLILRGVKTFLIVNHDRDFMADDLVKVVELTARPYRNDYTPLNKYPTGRQFTCDIPYVLLEHRYIKEGYFVLSIKPRL
jgi:Domain of unknown function (DUF3850)